MPGIAEAACRHGLASYNEPAQRVERGAQRIARQSGCVVEVDLPRYGARTTAPIKGIYTPRAALVRTVRPIGLTVATGPGSDRYSLVAPASSIDDAAMGGGTSEDYRREAAVHRHAAFIDQRIAEAARRGRLSPGKAAELHRQVGRVHIEAEHDGRTQSVLTEKQVSVFEETLNGIRRMVPRS